MRTTDSVLHLMPLEADVDNVVRRFHRMHRRNVAAAKKRGVTLQRGVSMEMVKQFYRLHLGTRRRQGVPVQPLRFFELLQQQVLSRGLGHLLLAHLDGDVWRGGVPALSPGADLQIRVHPTRLVRKRAANNLIFDQAIRWCLPARDYDTFDMGKTSLGNTGLRSFKSRWGAEEQSLVYSRCSQGVTVERKHRASRFAETVISRSPSIVCRVAGELFYRHFG